jgi:NAD(P)-dependent dehydrogenase (short-subunit alcohol dehydrogenase family)
MGGLLEKKIAVVTGGCRGIGEAIALKFAENGATVVIADIELSPAPEVLERIRRFGGEGLGVRLDVSDIEEVRRQSDSIRRRFGRIDIWVNNAGITQVKPIEELEGEDWDRIMNTDLRGTFFCSQACFRIMKEQGGGKIINIASIAGEQGGRFAGAHYSAAKAGVIVLTKCFALSGGEYNIQVNAIAPGFIKTRMAEELGTLRGDPTEIPLQRFGEPADVGNVALFLASDLSGYLTGTTIDVNGGTFMR